MHPHSAVIALAVVVKKGGGLGRRRVSRFLRMPGTKYCKHILPSNFRYEHFAYRWLAISSNFQRCCILALRGLCSAPRRGSGPQSDAPSIGRPLFHGKPSPSHTYTDLPSCHKTYMGEQ